MNKQKLHTTALFISILVVMLPIVEAQQLNGNQQNPAQQQYTITTNIPRYSKATIIDISGTTIPNATIELYIKNIKKRQTTTNPVGEFAINGVLLPERDNELRLRANDSLQNTAEQTYTVTVDTELPVFKIINFTAIATQPTLNIKAETSKPVNVTYTARGISDKTPPDKIQNLRKDRIEETGIAIAWDASTALDFFTYAVYRNNKRVATTTQSYYSDTQINQNTEYDYRISAVDTNCNEGQLSDTLVTKSPRSDRQQIQEPEEAKLGCKPEEKTMQVEHSGSFTIPIQLQEGQNEVSITAVDLAGHVVEYSNTTLLDTLLPEIQETNLDQISPTYIPDIKVKGVLNKKAGIIAYINNAKAAYVTSNDDGTFEIPLMLKRDVQITKGPKKTGLETGEGWENTVKLEAIDSAGRKSSPATGKITYSLCGFGSWFDVKIGEPSPQKLTPRFLLQGIQEAGLLFNATYKGRYNVTVGQITATSANLLSEELQQEYDNGLADVNLITQAQNPKSILGYLQVMFRPWTFPSDTKMTDYDKEKNISRHRVGAKGPKVGKGTALTGQYKNCFTPGIGCAKLFLQINIPFEEKIPKQIVDRTTQKTVTRYLPEGRVQKVCVPIEMMMDVPVPPKLIPKNFLRAAVSLLDKAVDALDAVLNPLTTIGQYVVYACLASTAWFYWREIQEAYSCEFTQALGFVEGSGTFDKAVAEAGLCQERYGTDSKDKEKLQNCNKCKNAIADSKKFQYEILQPICDRVACPSAPTLQSKIRNTRAGDIEPIDGVPPTSEKFKTYQLGGKIYSGDDCAFGLDQKEPALRQLSLTYTGVGNTLGIKDIYDLTKGKAGEVSWPSVKDCQEYTRPAHPACCGASYTREWAGACGPVPIAETFDELEQSTCLAAQKENKKLEANNEGLKCGGVLNAVAGMCEPDTGGEVIDPLPTYGIRYENKLEGTAVSDDVYLLIVPSNLFKTKSIKLATESKTDYRVYRGYVAQRFTTTKAKTEREESLKKLVVRGDKFALDVGAKTEAISDGTELTEFFKQEKKEGKTRDRDTLIAQFKDKLCTSPVDIDTCNRANINELYDTIYEKIGASDKEYIVKPEEGLLRSAQCVCLPSLTSNLLLWRNIMGATRDCMKSILLTGDGSEGVCKAVLSTYVCDLLFDVIKCFVQKFNSPGYGGRSKGGIGGFLGVLTSAGTEVQRKVQGRYGESALWKTMFVDRKLVHSICAFAFTGTWNFDASGIFSQTVENIPVQSQGFLTPCTRQFVSFSPATEPKGKVTWAYHFGVGLAAGADVRYDLFLKCSAGFRCNPADGFKNGECDCNKKGERTISIFAPELQPNPLKKNDILNKEIFYTVQAEGGDSDVRYDKAVLRYSYLDPKSNKEETQETTCDIKLTGGDAPAFCQADLFGYRCQFGVGESVVKLDAVEAAYEKHHQGTLAFGINDDVQVELSLRQQQPIERARSLEGTKFVFWTLRNQDGKEIIKPTDLQVFGDKYTLKQEGDYKRKITLKKIELADFASITPGTTLLGNFNQKIITAPYSILEKPQDTTLLKKFEPPDKTVPYILQFKEGKISIYRARSGIQKDTGEFDKIEPAIISNARIVAGTDVILYAEKTTPTAVEKQQIKLFLTDIPTEAEILLTPQEKKENPCTGEPKKVVQWFADIEIHDADRNGRPTQQISIDPGTGAQARKENIPINVACVDAASLSAITPITTTPVATTPPGITTSPAMPPITTRLPPTTPTPALGTGTASPTTPTPVTLTKVEDVPVGQKITIPASGSDVILFAVMTADKSPDGRVTWFLGPPPFPAGFGAYTSTVIDAFTTFGAGREVMHLDKDNNPLGTYTISSDGTLTKK